MYFAGIDIGSTMTKAVIIQDGILAGVTGPTGPSHRHLANEVMQKVLGLAGITFEALSYVVATGYGRINVPFADKHLTEITCHGEGVASLFPSAKTVIDIGGQDAKAIKLKSGRVEKFEMNDKCAAGTGRFLEVMADTLNISLEQMGQMALGATEKAMISNVCTIFAEQEVLARLSAAEPLPGILAGLFTAIAGRVLRLAARIGIEQDVVFTGGVATNPGIVKAIEDHLGFPVLIAQNPFWTGALGAALLGRKMVEKAKVLGRALPRSGNPMAPANLFQ